MDAPPRTKRPRRTPTRRRSPCFASISTSFSSPTMARDPGRGDWTRPASWSLHSSTCCPVDRMQPTTSTTLSHLDEVGRSGGPVGLGAMRDADDADDPNLVVDLVDDPIVAAARSEEHTSELQSLKR